MARPQAKPVPTLAPLAAGSRELGEIIARHLPHTGEREVLPAIFFSRTSTTTKPMQLLHEPAFVVLAQGEKTVVDFAGEEFVYDASHYLLSSVALPVSGRVSAASAARPYLGVRLLLPAALIGEVLVEAALPRTRRDEQALAKGIVVRPLASSLLDAVLRLTRLADAPEHARMLAPLALREIVYRLLIDEQGPRLRQIASLGGQTHRVARAIAWIRENFDKPMRIEQLAKRLAMSPSGLHHHFRAVTAMSPLQFQKTLRLHEARRLMIVEQLDAAGAGFRVGYNDPSQFTREYRRLFGAPPLRDVARASTL